LRRGALAEPQAFSHVGRLNPPVDTPKLFLNCEC